MSDHPEGDTPTQQGAGPPLFPPGVQQIAKDVLSPANDPATDQQTLKIGAAGAAPTVPLSATAVSRPKVPAKLGPYILGKELGHGGMGMVFRARHEKLGTECAVKVLIAGEHASLEMIARFQREAAAVARMGKHPNIVTVFDLGEEAGLAYYAMELLEGRSLHEEMKAREISPREAAEIVEKVARALHFAHQHGVIHRDIKPQNIQVSKAGEPQVVDFGLARDAGSEENLSITGQVMGTLAYMAPEQAMGEVSLTDARTDVYSLGGVLYELLTGTSPHPGRSFAATLPLILKGDIVPPRRLRIETPRDLETIVLKALALEQGRRYQTAEAFAEDLARWRKGEPVLARPLGFVGRTVRRVRRYPVLSALVALVILATLGMAWRFLGPARIAVTAEPANATVKVHGRTFVGTRWVWPAGEVPVEVSARDYEPQVVALHAAPGSTGSSTKVTLRHEQGTLDITGSPQAIDVLVLDAEGHEKTHVTPPVALPLETGRYTLVASLKDHFQRTYPIEARKDATARAHVSLERQVLWRSHAQGGVIWGSRPALVDVDGDGGPDCVVGTDQGNVCAFSGRDGSLIWSRFIKDFVTYGPEVGDLDGDGIPDFVLGTKSGVLFALSGEGGGSLWSTTVGGSGDLAGVLSMSVGDLDGDGLPDCVATVHGTKSVLLVALSGMDGKELWRREMGEAARGYASARIADLDCDGDNEVLVGAYDGCVYALSGKDGRVRWAVQTGSMVTEAPSVADLDGDGILDCVVGSWGPDVTALSGKDGQKMWSFQAGKEVTISPALADLDKDGGPDLVFGSADGFVYAVSGATGKELWRQEVGGRLDSPISIVDVEAVPKVILPTNGGDVYALSGSDGRVLWKNNLGPAVGHLAAADVDRDGGVDCVIGGTDGTITALSLQEGGRAWSNFVHGGHAPAVSDVDGDGVPDCVVSSEDRAVHALSGRDGRELWSVSLPDVPRGVACAGDLDGDGDLDFVVGCTDYCVYALAGKDGRRLWSFKTGNQVNQAPVSLEIGGRRIVFAPSGDGKVYALAGGDGKPLWTHATRGESCELALGDLGARGHLCGVVSATDGMTEAFSCVDGRGLWSASVTRLPNIGHPAIGDLQGGGTSDVVVSTQEGRVVAFSGRDGGQLWTFLAGGPIRSEAALADLDGDGGLDSVVGSLDGSVYALSGKDGRVLWSSRTGERVIRVLAPFDFDGDGVKDIVAGTESGVIEILSGATGAPLWRAKAGGVAILYITVADLDGDGWPEILPEHSDGVVQVLEVPRRFAPTPLAALRYAGLWELLARRANEEARGGGTQWDRARASVDLGVALVHLGKASEALDAFDQAAKLGLRHSPDAAVHGMIASLSWETCPDRRREASNRRLRATLTSAPDLVFEAMAECGELLAAPTVREGLQKALAANEGPVAVVLRASLLQERLPKEALLASQAALSQRLATGEGSVAHNLAYLALLARALGDDGAFQRLHASYLEQQHRPLALDRLLDADKHQ